MKTKAMILVLCSAMSMGLFAQNDSIDAQVKEDRYTFGDFFDALDLPTVLGAGFTPNGIEGATFNSAMRLGWRHHKNYGTFVYITYDTHSNKYENLDLQFAGCNLRTAEVWYNEVGMSVGYRFPLVKDIKKFYEQPYFHPWDMYVSVQPGVSIATIKNAALLEHTEGGVAYELESLDHAVPTLRFSTGIEWFIMHNFSVFAELAYTQHLLPTIIEQAAINQGEIRNPSGPLTVSIGLSLFFN
jgi:hypothetical protein